MMKGFVSIFKMLGLATLVIGLTVAGCASPSDVADQAKGMVDHGTFTIPVNVNPADQSLTFGNGSNAASGTFSGHVVELQTVNCAGNGTPADQTSCSIRVINRDPSMYMANTMVMLSYCQDCVTAPNWANADCTGSPCLRPCGVDPDGISGCSSYGAANWPVGTQAGFCITEDGNYAAGQPYTAKGCSSRDTVASDFKPAQVISPACGYEDVQWDFATTDGTWFTFYANVAAEWYPIDPHADSRINANDWYNRTTLAVMITSLDDAGLDGGFLTAVGNPWWNYGAYQNAAVLSGFGGAATVSLPAGRYFAVNVAAEFADRMEAQTPGFYTNFSDYEYGVLYAEILRFNPAVTLPVATSGTVGNGSFTSVIAGPVDNCVTCAHETGATSRKLYPSVNGNVPHDASYATTAFADKGFVYSFPLMDAAAAFNWNTSAAVGTRPWVYYSMVGGSMLCVRAANIVPIHAGHYGRAHMDVQGDLGGVGPCFSRTTATNVNMRTSELTTVFQEGIDAAADMPIGMFYFKVNNSATSGLGTMFYPEAHSGYYGYIYAYTGHTRDGGAAGGSDDWTSYCNPLDPGSDNATLQGCPSGKIAAIPDVDWVFKGQEQSNPKMSQTGFAVPGAGTFIGWTGSICVQ